MLQGPSMRARFTCTSVSGQCADGVCCDSACEASGQACNRPGRLGECLGDPGAACDADAGCTTGHCADGVCCNAPCDGACDRCDLDGNLGLCAPAPEGALGE